MKKILSVVLMAAMLLSMTACGASTGTPESTTEGTKAITTAIKEDNAEKTTAIVEIENEEITADTNEEETKVYTPYIQNQPKLFQNSCVVFSASPDGQSSGSFVYNIAENKMMQYELETGAEIVEVSGSVAVFKVNADFGVLNLQTGEIMVPADSEGIKVLETGFYNNAFKLNASYISNGYVFVYKIEEKFSGNVFNFGIINDKGEWVVPLSSELSIKNCLCGYGISSTSFTSCGLMNDNTIAFYFMDKLDDYKTKLILYRFDTDVVYDLTELLDDHGNIQMPAAFIDNDTFCVPTSKGFLKYDINNCSFEYDNRFEYGHYKNDYYYFGINNNLLVFKGNEVFDRSLNKIADFDLSEYETVRRYYYTENRVVFSCDKNGSEYMGVLNADGTFPVEPVQALTIINEAYVANELCVFLHDFDACILDLASGESKYYNHNEDSVFPLSYDPITNSFIVRGSHPVYGEGYFLTDGNDFNTLINPFEIAE